jgi:predicted small lipoprotein YifL
MFNEMRKATSPVTAAKTIGHTRQHLLRLSCFVLLCSFLGGCGIKGALYLPEGQAVAVEPPPPVTAPTPAPQDTTK